MTRGLVRIIVLAAGAVLLAAASETALASAPVGPNQHFLGLVNGKHSGAVIYTVCPGPAGGSGPVSGGQKVSVQRVKTGGGDTGAGGHVIYAVIAQNAFVALKAYGSAQPMPTSIRVPCQGTGTVTFTTCPLPQPCGAGARSDRVPVTYENLAA